MNRNKNPSIKGKNIYLNACLLPKVPSKEHLLKLVCLATPGILHDFVVSFASHIVFAIISVWDTVGLLSDNHSKAHMIFIWSVSYSSCVIIS